MKSHRPSVKVLKPARKIPQQERSRFLVAAVKDACLKVLQEEGVSALTTSHLAEVAGVSVGSLYQYFADIESVVAAVYADLAERNVRNRRSVTPLQPADTPLDIAMLLMIRRVIDFHRELLELNFEFHCRYHRYFDLDRFFNESVENPQGSIMVVAEMLRANKVVALDNDFEALAFLILRSVASLIMEILDDRPQMIFNDDLDQTLLRMCLAAIPPSQNSQRGA